MFFTGPLAVVLTCLVAVLVIALIEMAAFIAISGIRFLPARLDIRLLALAVIGALAVGGIIKTVVVAYHRIAPLLPAI